MSEPVAGGGGEGAAQDGSPLAGPHGSSPAGTPRRGTTALKVGLGCLLAMSGCCVTWIAGPRVIYSMRVAGSVLDARLIAEAPDERLAEECARIIGLRLRKRGTPAKVRAVGRRIEIEHEAAALATVRLALRRGDIRVLLVVEDSAPPGDDPRRETLEYEGKPLVVESPGVGSGQVDDVYPTEDADGRPVVGVKFTREGAKAMRELTSRGIGRRAALVVDGQVRTTPVIRSEIGARCVIEAGPAGWAEGDLLRVIALLRYPLPCDLVEVR